MMNKSPITAVSCSVLRPELDALKKRGMIDFPVCYMDSELHMRPDRLFRYMNRIVQNLIRKGRKTLLLFGDCHAHISELCASASVARTQAVNCCELLMGRDLYRKDRTSRPFYLLPEWTLRWEEILGQIMDMSREMTIEMIRESHTRFVYLNSGVVKIPEEELERCSRYFGLPYEIRNISLEHLCGKIFESMNALGEARGENG